MITVVANSASAALLNKDWYVNNLIVFILVVLSSYLQPVLVHFFETTF